MSDQLHHLRHSAAHMLAAAILQLYPGTKLGTGPVVDNGFYYDVLLPQAISESDLAKIEKTMRKIIAGNHEFIAEQITAEAAKQYFAEQPFKQELVDKFAQDGRALTLYHSGPFTDLCEGGHAANTKELAGVGLKLHKLAGAYWQADASRPQMTRIYGLLFTTPQELEDYVKQLEEAEKRDHRKLGKELGLFIFSDLVGPGLPLYTPKGALVRRLIQQLSRDQRECIGYEEVHTPNMNKAELFKISGHYDKYKDDMFRVQSNYSEEEYFLKPMNCPQHTQIYASQLRSYKELPLRLADFANLYRDEKPGELSGLTRLRAFSQDDAHCFCREDQIKEEFSHVLSVIERELQIYGMNYYVRLSLWDPAKKENYLGDAAVWEKSQALLEDLLKEKQVNYVLGVGDAAFYGPKMDFIAKDSLGREWQISTIQIDFNMPKRFGLEYVASSGEKQTPVMIHSALVGSPERFLAILLEHYAGNFPLWLAPIQVQFLAVSDSHAAYCQELAVQFKAAGLRAAVNGESETIGKKIRKTAQQKIPYLVVVGDREKAEGTLAVSKRGSRESTALTVADFIQHVVEKNQTRALEL